nr:uncharacterized protein LOC124816798 [Hydra vulgaris]
MFSSECKTRNCTKSKFNGSPNPLANTEPPTNRQIIQEFYFLNNTYPSFCFSVMFNTYLSFCFSLKLIAEKIIMIWRKVNTRLPFMSSYCVEKSWSTSKHIQIPVEKRLYMKDQREKSGPNISLQLGSVDRKWSRKESLKKHKTEYKNVEESLQQETFNLFPELLLSESDSEPVISSSSEI